MRMHPTPCDGPRRGPGLLAGLCLAACLGAIAPGQASPDGGDGWIRTWLICGPFQTAGFSMVAPFWETTLRPNAWETHTDEWAPDRSWQVTWRPYTAPTDDVDFDAEKTFAGRPSMDWPPGWPGSAYAHLYVASRGQRDLLLDFHASGPARVWVNGRDISQVPTLASGVSAAAGHHPSPGDAPQRRPITLLPGVNRILAKLYFPQKDYGTGLARPTRFRVRFLDVDGSPAGGLRYALNDPGLYAPDRELRAGESAPPAGTCLADLTEVGTASKRPRHVFYTGQTVSLNAMIGLLKPDERIKRFGRSETRYDSQTFAARLSANLYDYHHRVVGRTSSELRYGLVPARAALDFGVLARGHYTLYCRLHLGGQLLTTAPPTMVAVVARPHALPAGVVSKFAHSYYYLGTAEPEFAEVLAAAGARLNVGSMHWWWLTEDPKEWVRRPPDQRRWENVPKEENLAAARRAGVEMTGDLGGCFTAEFRKGYYDWYDIPEDARGKLVVINPYWEAYPYDAPEFPSLVRGYVTATVARFRRHFRYWKLQNEVNLVPGMSPEMFGHILQATYGAAKRADPRCVIVNASMSGTGLNFLEPLFQQGYDRYFDVLDYHVYAWPFYDPTQSMGGLEQILELMARYGVRKPLWNGEFGAYRSLWEDGARAQAGAWVRYLVVAHTYDQLERVAAHFHDYGGWSAAGERGQFPAYVAYRTCADNLEGAVRHEKLHLGAQIAAYRFRQGDSRVMVLWTRDGAHRKVVVPVGKPRVRVVEMLGAERWLAARHGKMTLPVAGDPVYVRE